MKVTNVARRVWTTALVKVVLHCKIFLVDILARASFALSQFRGLSDWLGGHRLTFSLILQNKRKALKLTMVDAHPFDWLDMSLS